MLIKYSGKLCLIENPIEYIKKKYEESDSPKVNFDEYIEDLKSTFPSFSELEILQYFSDSLLEESFVIMKDNLFRVDIYREEEIGELIEYNLINGYYHFSVICHEADDPIEYIEAKINN